MDYRKEYKRWLEDSAIDKSSLKELQDIATNESEIKDRFYTNLSFGTAGMRGVMGIGANRMNIYTVRRATQGLANYILSQGTGKKGVVIAYDCRNMSAEFCKEAALVLNGNGIPCYVFDSLRPTPQLSFAVRYLGCTAGIVITASHNPPEYNGYKVYWDDGGQVPYPRDYAIIKEVDKITDFSEIKSMPKAEAKESGLFRMLGSEIDEAYVQAVLKERRQAQYINVPLKIVFSPLHGAGNILTRRVLSEAGYTNVHVVEAQVLPDGNFPTVISPNPEDPSAFTLAEELAKKIDADIMICTDPDADRMGAAIRVSQGKYLLLTGNMIGALLTEYVLSQGNLPPNSAVISTIVSTKMTKAIAKFYGITYMEVLTGFKYIGEKIKEFEESGKNNYIFGFEESYGYLAGTHARDKDAICATLLFCEMTAFYAEKGKTLWDVMQDAYTKYGFYKEASKSITLKGVDGLEDMRRIMSQLRENPLAKIGSQSVTEVRDYINGFGDLPKSDVLYFQLEDDSWVCIRPSGTEPKIKFYIGTLSKNSTEEADSKLADIADALTSIGG